MHLICISLVLLLRALLFGHSSIIHLNLFRICYYGITNYCRLMLGRRDSNYF